jgi:type I restriction enzyme S subunit
MDVPAMEKQDEAIAKLGKIETVVALRQQELQKLDELVKARFVEMFVGLPAENYATLESVCSIITDGTHQPPKFVSDGIPFLFVSNIVTNKITYDAEKFIDEDTYTELIKRTPIAIGDILLSTVGSYGHPAVVKSEQRFCFQRHIAYLKPKPSIVNSDFVHGALLSENVQRQIEERVKGIAQKTLNLSEIRKIQIPLPPMEQQKEFAAFVAQVDKSKLTIQQGLDKLELLKKALMQKYFG